MTPAQTVERTSGYSEDGIDLTLIDWMLSLTPAERPGCRAVAIRA